MPLSFPRHPASTSTELPCARNLRLPPLIPPLPATPEVSRKATPCPVDDNDRLKRFKTKEHSRFGRAKHEATRSHGNRKAASGGISPTIQHGVLNPNRMHPGKGVALGVALDRVALVA